MDALHWAVQMKNNKVVETLIEFGANPNFGDYEGVTPIRMARSQGLSDIISSMEKVSQPSASQVEAGFCNFLGFCTTKEPDVPLLPSKRK